MNADEATIRVAMAMHRLSGRADTWDEPAQNWQLGFEKMDGGEGESYSSAADLEVCRGYPADAYLLDAYVLVKKVERVQLGITIYSREKIYRHRLFVAGGLRPENVADAIATTGCAVDTASGVE